MPNFVPDGPPLPVIEVSSTPKGRGSITPFRIGMGELPSVLNPLFPTRRFVFHKLPAETVDRMVFEISDTYEKLGIPAPIFEEHIDSLVN